MYLNQFKLSKINQTAPFESSLFGGFLEMQSRQTALPPELANNMIYHAQNYLFYRPLAFYVIHHDAQLLGVADD